MYQKAECTCLCVPAHLLSTSAASALDGGVMFYSEDEADDDWRAGARSPRRAAAGPVAPTSPRSMLTTQDMCGAHMLLPLLVAWSALLCTCCATL